MKIDIWYQLIITKFKAIDWSSIININRLIIDIDVLSIDIDGQRLPISLIGNEGRKSIGDPL